MTLLDHLLVFVLVVALPWEGRYSIRRLAEACRRGDLKARSRTLFQVIAIEWALTLALLAGWQSAGRAWPDLGLTVVSGWRAVVGALVVLAALGLVWLQRRSVMKLSPERCERLKAKLGDTVLLLPTNAAERRLFAATAMTAGVCEELLCRGFLLWYLGHWMGPWVAVVVGAIPFGVAHLYQGRKGVVKTGVMGLLLGVLFVGTGSLLWPMIVHAAIDLGAGMLGDRLGRPVEHESNFQPAPQA
jgi:membrane protease YdiL (CAAX protease family)